MSFLDRHSMLEVHQFHSVPKVVLL